MILSKNTRTFSPIRHYSRKIALASAIAVAMAAAVSPVLASEVANDVIEARQESQIWTSYALSPYLKAHDLKVTVNDGTATLTGKVAEEVNKELAGEIAMGVSGIKKVDNQILVDAAYIPAATAGERSFSEVVEDASITTAVKSKLLWSKHAKGLTAKVHTVAGRVALTGTADSAAAKSLAGQLAMNTRGVVAVSNKLVITKYPVTLKESVKDTADDVGDEFSDAWITTKVKSTLMYSSNINSANVTVATQDGIVTLGGMVNNSAEKALAAELAGNVKGVSKVDAKGLTHP